MTRSDELRIVPLPAVPVRYAFLSVHRIVGFSSLPAGQSLPIDLGLEGVTASLVADPNPALIEIDRRSAIAMLMMSAFVVAGVFLMLRVTVSPFAANEFRRLRLPGRVATAASAID